MGHDLPPLPLRDVHTVRWYVLSLPACHKGPAKGLSEGVRSQGAFGRAYVRFFRPLFRGDASP